MHGALRPGLRPDDPAVRDLVSGWSGRVHLYTPPDGGPSTVVLVGPPPPDDRPRWWVHAVLLALTLFTTHMAGALMQGVDPLAARPWSFGPFVLPIPTALDLRALASGAPFALSFVGILLAHELGHYLAALRHGVRVTPPFFLPFPAYYSVVGTLGAFIRIKGPTVRRSVLLDIGAAGPLASFFLSVPTLAAGLALSTSLPGSADPLAPFLIRFAGVDIMLGTSVLVEGVVALLVPGGNQGPLLLHPVAFAGWLGLFVTALNLLPLGQLDGGHILYALWPRRQVSLARMFLVALVPLGWLWWGWWFWGAAAVLVSRGRLAHPPVLQPEAPVGPVRAGVAWLSILIFLATFSPRPIGF